MTSSPGALARTFMEASVLAVNWRLLMVFTYIQWARQASAVAVTSI